MSLPPETPDALLNIALHGLYEAGKMQEGLGGVARVRNSQSHLHKDMDQATLAQRQMFLDVAHRVLNSEMLDAYDKACVKYLQVRGLFPK